VLAAHLVAFLEVSLHSRMAVVDVSQHSRITVESELTSGAGPEELHAIRKDTSGWILGSTACFYRTYFVNNNEEKLL
jgi:hypothetical protein